MSLYISLIRDRWDHLFIKHVRNCQLSVSYYFTRVFMSSLILLHQSVSFTYINCITDNPNTGQSTNHSLSGMNIAPGGPAFFGQPQLGGLNLNSRLGGSDQITFHQEVKTLASTVLVLPWCRLWLSVYSIQVISTINHLCTYDDNSGGVHVNAIFNEMKRKFPNTTSDDFNRTLTNLVNNGEVYTGAADNLYMAL